MKTSRVRRIAALFALGLFALIVTGCADQLIVLDPKGPIGEQQRDLIYITVLLCAIIIVPTIILAFVFAWRYRDKKDSKAKYTPEWEHNGKLEAIWWGIPIVIIIVLGIVTVNYTYKLEPSKPIAAEEDTLTIQVASLDWKWLFMYPEEGIATVNYVRFPEDKAVRFELTSDAPMNSFWIPQLGGQIYTMSGMAMKLHLKADEPGQYLGSGANFSGRDFAKMQFTAEATSEAEYDAWVEQVKQGAKPLTLDGYKLLSKPSAVESPIMYGSFPEGLFEQIVTKYAASHSHGLSTREAVPAAHDHDTHGDHEATTDSHAQQHEEAADSGHHHHE